MGTRTCKVCGFTAEYLAGEHTARLKGFHGYVCWKCIVEEQRAWRGTDLGREESRETSKAYRQRKRAKMPTTEQL